VPFSLKGFVLEPFPWSSLRWSRRVGIHFSNRPNIGSSSFRESLYSPDELTVEVERLTREDAQNAAREAEQREERNTDITRIYDNEHGANGAT
jgi:hypothetical protein